MNSQEEIHARRRMFLENETASSRELVRMLLEYGGITKGADKIADSLLSQYLTIEVLLSQRYDVLLANEGMTERAALLFSLVMPMFSRSYTSEDEGCRLLSNEKIGEYFVHKFLAARHEHSYMLLLDRQGRFIDCIEMSNGDISEVTISHARVLETITSRGAFRVAIAHNHPSGSSLPSDADRKVTDVVRGICKAVAVEFIGHYVIGKNTFSLA